MLKYNVFISAHLHGMASWWKLVIFLPNIAKQISNLYKRRITGAILTASLNIIEFSDIKTPFFPEEGSSTYHPNFATFLPDFTSSHPRQPCSFLHPSVKSMSVPSLYSLSVAQYCLLTNRPFAHHIRYCCEFIMLPWAFTITSDRKFGRVEVLSQILA
jgi:hypothetical protein